MSFSSTTWCLSSATDGWGPASSPGLARNDHSDSPSQGMSVTRLCWWALEHHGLLTVSHRTGVCLRHRSDDSSNRPRHSRINTWILSCGTHLEPVVRARDQVSTNVHLLLVLSPTHHPNTPSCSVCPSRASPWHVGICQVLMTLRTVAACM